MSTVSASTVSEYGFDSTGALCLLGVFEYSESEIPMDEIDRDYWEQSTKEVYQLIDHKDRTVADRVREEWAGTPLPINIWKRYGDRYFSANGPVTITESDPLLEQLNDLEEGRFFKWKEAAKILQEELRDIILIREVFGWSAINEQIKRAKLEREAEKEKIL